MGSRRQFLTNSAVVGSAGLVLAAVRQPAQAAPRSRDLTALWLDWSRNFVRDDGRVMDTGNNDIAHSEGQGTALLGAVSVNDRTMFERVLKWTEDNLRDPETGLFFWRYDPASDNPVQDRNNATDGDLMIAWALWWAGQQWNDPGLRQAAQQLIDEIYTRLRRPVGDLTLLMPGRLGFETAEQLTVNLSYAIFPAFAACAEARPDQPWQAISDSYISLIRKARFGKFGLPPDWLALPVDWNGDPALITPADGWAPRFGYDAIRVPLYLVWGGYDGADLAPFNTYWEQFAGAAFMPDWIDLTDDTVPVNDALPGFYTVWRLALLAAVKTGAAGQAVSLPKMPDLPRGGDSNYYSASLTLLCAMAAGTRGMRL